MRAVGLVSQNGVGRCKKTIFRLEKLAWFACMSEFPVTAI